MAAIAANPGSTCVRAAARRAQHEPEDLQAKIERLRQYRGAFDLGHDFPYGLFDREETQVLGSSGCIPVSARGAGNRVSGAQRRAEPGTRDRGHCRPHQGGVRRRPRRTGGNPLRS